MNHLASPTGTGPPERPPAVTWPRLPIESRPRPPAAPPPIRPTPCSDRQFIDLLSAYRALGGLARAAEVLEMFDSTHRGELSRLARQIVDRQVISVDWHQETWLPPVLAELNGVYDPLELAQWFARPNSALADRAPATVLIAAPPSGMGGVMQAARTDRFVAHGC